MSDIIVLILICRALFGYDGQSDVLKLVSKGGKLAISFAGSGY